MDDDRAFLGRGWAFPVTLDSDGEVRTVSHDEDVEQAVRLILATDHGERAMRPLFGAGLRALAFEPMGATTRTLVRLRVEQALIAWEPRIDVVDIRVSERRATGTLVIEVEYRVRATNSFYNLVYPFHLDEGRA